MAGCPTGQTSSSKPTWTGATIAIGLSELAGILNIITSPWGIPFAGYLGLLTYDADVLCQNPPPATPTITTADLVALFTLDDYAAHLTAVSKFSDAVAGWLWPQVCQCSGGGAPTAPATPTAPTVVPQINPPSIVPILHDLPCVDKTFISEVAELSAGAAHVWPGPNSLSEQTPADAGPDIIQFDWSYVLESGVSGVNHQLNYYYIDSTSTLQVIDTAFHNGDTLSHQLSPLYTLPAGYKFVYATNGSTPQNCTVRHTVNAKIWCAGTSPNNAMSPCCPPDPAVTGALQQIQNYLQIIFQSLPTPAHSYAEATVHSGLSGNGSVTFTGAPLALKVTITTDSGSYGSAAGTPTYLFDRGFLVPFSTEGPIWSQVRLSFSPQIIQLPQLADAIGYSLSAGIVISITELVAGP